MLKFFSNLSIVHVCERFQIYGKLWLLEDVLISQNIDSRYFCLCANTIPYLHSPYHPCSHNSPPGSIITPQATMTWNIRLFIFSRKLYIWDGMNTIKCLFWRANYWIGKLMVSITNGIFLCYRPCYEIMLNHDNDN